MGWKEERRGGEAEEDLEEVGSDWRRSWRRSREGGESEADLEEICHRGG